MKKSFLFFILFSMSPLIFADYIATNASVLKVRNTASNTNTFEIVLEEGSTICNGQVIAFPHTKAASPEVHSRGYALALTALTTGMKIRVYSYTEVAPCRNAAYIELSR